MINNSHLLGAFRTAAYSEGMHSVREEKCEMDYGTLEQWEQDCAGYTGPWMWSMLEYP